MTLSPQPPSTPFAAQMLSARNVEILSSDGLSILAGIYQYGQVTYHMLYKWLQFIIVTNVPWVLHEWDAATQVRGVPIASDETLVREGLYVVAGTDGSPIEVSLTDSSARIRHPTVSDISAMTEHYTKRICERDPCCLVSHEPACHIIDYIRFDVAHIFPRAHDTEWISKGFASKITDSAPLNEVGGSLKIDSVQNLLLMRKDLHAGFDSYCFSISPDDGYKIIPFIPGYDSIAGKTLKLDHIQDPSLRPLDDLLRDHFLQAILRHMKGELDANEIWDFDDALGGGFDLSRNEVWGGELGKQHLEFELGHRLHSFQVQQANEI